METKISMVIASHLNDAYIEVANGMHTGNRELITSALNRIRFIKYLNHFYGNRTQGVTESDLDELWKRSSDISMEM